MKYYKRYWDEVRGDQHNGWGESTWYFQLDDSSKIVRQIEIYENGKVLKYSTEKPKDGFGGLGKEFDEKDFAPYEIGKEDFDKVWGA